MAFIPPQGNQTVMVDSSNNIVYPASFQKVVATQATIAGNNFTDVPSVIDPENATTTQLPSVASVVNYVADVVEGGSSGLIPAIQSNIQTLGQVKSNRGEFWFNGGRATISNMSMNGLWSLCCRIRMQTAQVQSASIFHLGAFYLYWNTRLGVYCPPAIASVNQISVDDNNRLANGEWHSLVVSYDGTTLKLTDETGVLLSVATSEPISISDDLLIGESNYNGQIADIKYFNFDMSDANAPYTIDDYIAGKDESPLLYGGAYNLNSQSDWLAFHNNEGAFTSTGSDLIFTASEDATIGYIVFYVNADVKAGSKIDFSIESISTISSATFKDWKGVAGTASGLNTSGESASILYGNSTSFTTTADATKIGFWLWKSGTFTTGETLTLVNPQIRVNGALLSLDDYSIKVGATQIVPDVSGNNNDATITGLVFGSKDTSISKMAQLFYQSQQG